jgi:GntR family transcriptional regulator
VELNKRSPIPLYYQLASLLREQMRQGALTPGSQLPPERQLSELYGISRMTVRQALTYLIREGALVVRRGFGTFVAEPKLTHDALFLLGFSEEVRRSGGTPVSQVLEQGVAPAPAAVAAALRLAPDTPVVKAVRLRLADGVPVLLETSYVPAAICPALAQADLAVQSLYAVLEREGGVVLKRTRQELEATVANDYERGLFAVAPHTPMILLAGTTFDEADRPVEYFKAIYRGDRFKFSFESERSVWLEQRPGAPRMSVVLS